MSPFFTIHPENPQKRLITQAVAIIRAGGIIIYPTDSCYAFGCQIGDKAAMERMSNIRQTDKNHNFTLVCRDLSEIGTYAKVENATFRLMKSITPGPYTFILKATHEVPRRLQNPKRKTIGLRVPDNAIAQAILEILGEPIMSSTLIMPGKDIPETEPDRIKELLEKQVDLILDGGHCGFEPTTIVDMMSEPPEILRHGKGPVDVFKTD
ncbi:MAG: threonylcarbamoyl-AMP synthase [Candidatus Parabeggiatoa sp. nov. 3]|nr:MAG: threonylcarbamoyl-AMP synthase [Gammaproteobacteria bacterium]RKZ65449.1 MAG: threonylcarbamoyl-AMP synthase [Gammaproteobacteria bacterium]RKZ82953.1 MAG: threonylcarbamoyl-AMP synthase [Gammaproteobacteria bacterium]